MFGDSPPGSSVRRSPALDAQAGTLGPPRLWRFLFSSRAVGLLEERGRRRGRAEDFVREADENLLLGDIDATVCCLIAAWRLDAWHWDVLAAFLARYRPDWLELGDDDEAVRKALPSLRMIQDCPLPADPADEWMIFGTDEDYRNAVNAQRMAGSSAFASVDQDSLHVRLLLASL